MFPSQVPVKRDFDLYSSSDSATLQDSMGGTVNDD